MPSNSRLIPHPGALLLLALSGFLAGGPTAAGQDPRTEPAIDVARLPGDTYRDEAARTLLERARVARHEIAEGLESYEARMWERSYFGLSGPLFRRERGLLDQERVSRIRWTRQGEHTVRWEGARRDSPVLGRSSADDEAFAAGLVRDLSGRREGVLPWTIPPPLSYDPGSDRIAFGSEWALNPLADTAAYHYRYESGDTLRLTLPGTDRRVVLAEVRVEPRRTEFRLVSASLWFDTESGALVRAGYRPARPFDMELDQPDDPPPGFLRPIVAEIRYVTVDHGLYDLQWWIPRRFSFEGEARVAAVATFPVTLEWTVDEVRVNGPETLTPEALPPDWIRRELEIERDGSTRTITVFVPTAAELAASPELTRAPPSGAALFSPSELRELERLLERLAPPAGAPGIRVAWGLQEQLTRYNRIEGLSTGVAARADLPYRFELRVEGRYGFSDREPGGELRVRRGVPGRSEEVAIFRRLVGSSEWGRTHGLGSSLRTLVLGNEHAPFHRSWGAEATFRRDGRPVGHEVRLFVERQDSAFRGTDRHLRNLWSDRELPDNPASTEGWWTGSSVAVRWQAGLDPREVTGFGVIRAEAATGATGYLRGWTSAGVTGPIGTRLTGALEGGVGGSAGELPLQRRFVPGGPSIFRGAAAGELAGDSFWFARAELGPAPRGLRLVAFLDALEVGAPSGIGRTEPLLAAGIGASLMDGLIRLDVGRNLRGERKWQLFFYVDGLF